MAEGLLEREREIQRISSLLDATATGSGSVMLITGVPGIGKTELLRQAEELAAEEGFRTLRARGSEIEQGFAQGVIRQLFEPAVANASSLERRAWFVGAASLARPLIAAPDGEPSQQVRPVSTGDPALPLYHGLYWLCHNMAADGPLLISVDDLQWSDEASVRFLMYLALRLEGLSIMLLMAARASENSTELATQLERGCKVESFVLPALSEEATGAMLRGGLGETSPAFVSASHASTGGNPFLVKELIRAMHSAGANPADASPSAVSRVAAPGLAKSVLLRAKNASREAAELAQALALLGDGADLRHAAKLCGLEIAQAGKAADALVASDILKDTRPLEFVHPLVRSAIYADLSPWQRSLRHGAAARLLADDGEPVQKVATHLVEAEPNGDRWVVKSLRMAAEDALSRGAPSAAIAFLRRALKEPPSPAERPGVLHELGKAEQRDEPSVAVEHLREAFELQPDPEAGAKTGLELLRALFNAGRIKEAVEVVENALEALGDRNLALAMQLDAELISLLRIGVATSPLAYERLDRWKGKVRGDSPPERVLMLHLSVVSALSGANAKTFGDLAEKALGKGLLLAEHGPDSLLPYLPLYPLMCADRYDVVEASLAESFSQAQARGSPLAFALSSGWRSYLESAKGDVKEAEADALNAFNVAVELPNPAPVLVPGAVEALITPLIEQSEFARAEATLQQWGLEGDLPDAVPFRFLLASRGYLRLAEGNAQEAMRDFVELMGREERTGPANLFLTPFRSLAALAAKQLGQAAQARRLAQEALDKARAWGAHRELGNALRFAGVVESGPKGLELLHEAVQVLEPSPARLVHASALVDLGTELARVGQRREGMEKLRQGLDLAHRCGARRLQERAYKELLRLGARPRRPAIVGEESLTASERRVCQLAADGLSNRDIAESLFVTTRTVELHLTHAYQKLGIRSREEVRKVLRTAESFV